MNKEVIVIGKWQLADVQVTKIPAEREVWVVDAIPSTPIRKLVVSNGELLPRDDNEAATSTSAEFLNEMNISILPSLIALPSSTDADNSAVDVFHDLTNTEQELMREGIESYQVMDMENALRKFENVLRVNSDNFEAIFNISCVHQYLGYPILALRGIEKLLINSPSDHTVHALLWALTTSSQYPPPLSLVCSVYTNLADRGDLQAKTRLAVLTGRGESASRTDEAYVRSVFDNMAEVFEVKLTKHLQYDAPWVLQNQLQSYLDAQNQLDSSQTANDSTLSSSSIRHLREKGSWRILDLGCGSGLCAKVFREYFTSPTSDSVANLVEASQSVQSMIIGIDISPKILAIAQSLGFYGGLECCDVLQALRHFHAVVTAATGVAQEDRQLDMVIAADTFVYLGALGEIFARTRDILRIGGLFAFSTEDLENSPMRMDDISRNDGADGEIATNESEFEISGAVPGWGACLLRSARFGHSNRYIEALCHKYHFQVVRHEVRTLRTEETVPLQGNMFLLQRVSVVA